MLIEHNPYSFLTGDDPFLELRQVENNGNRYTAELEFQDRHEGFIGIPHGGLPMGLCLDVWLRSPIRGYPVDVRFKFGGSGIAIGDGATLTAERAGEGLDPGIVVRISKAADKTPYLSACMTPARTGVSSEFTVPTPSSDFRSLPYYRNCFVCGHHRTAVGLQRRFRLHEENGSYAVTTPWGHDSADFDRAAEFLIAEEELHPAVLISIFDENTAWGGFMDTRAGGLSVRLDFTILRPVARTEKLIFVGRPAGIRGNPKAPRFFKGEGQILSLADPHHPEPVAYGRGEWVILTAYTEQIKSNLLPAGDWSWIFSS
ncbi:MAG: hypothetical protein RDU20_00185 [Desulfomonilaceae bacterium]|nr:hypothetical protein [Desulfomonilaceae bacterium]